MLKSIYWFGIISLTCLSGLSAQTNPATREDSEAERKKLLRAADQIDIIQAELDTLRAQADQNRAEIDRLKNDLAAARNENAMLKNDILALKTAVEKLDAVRAQEREVLLKEVSKIVADGSKNSPAPVLPPPVTKKEEPPVPQPENSPAAETGYTYTVQKGDTLWAIVEAYREQGVKVTVEEIRRANKMSKSQSLQTGQTLFIPKKSG
jgi:LysM repeat protein